jgi:hypothetical protein
MSHPTAHFIKYALPLFGGVWLMGAPLMYWLGGMQALGIWSIAAAALFVVGLLGELGASLTPAAAKSPLLRMFIGMMTRGALVVGLIVLAHSTTPLDGWLEDKRWIAFSVIPFYFALLTVEILAAKSILASPQPGPLHGAPAPSPASGTSAELQVG